jgi:hypothetical protein
MLARMVDTGKLLLRHAPPVERLVKRICQNRRFTTEWALIRGMHRNENRHPSVIHFSFNKAATQYVKSILRRCAVDHGMVPVGIHDYAFHSDFPFLDLLSAREMEKYQHIFKSEGYLYSVFGGMIEGIPHLEKYKVLLVARDPRDILVSEYYSVAYSHPAPDKAGDKHDEFTKKRLEARRTTIDEYVMSEKDSVRSSFLRYQNLLLNTHPHVYLTSYERMVSDFNTWLRGLLDYCEFDISEGLLQSLLKENEHIRPKQENIHKHLRKGRPGDYREKLQAETITCLDAEFAPILAAFGYCLKQTS